MAVEDEKHNKIENIMKRRRKPRGQPCKSTPNTFSRGLPFLSYPSYPAITRHTTAGFLLLVVAIISAPTTSVLNFVLGPGREGVRVAGALAALCTSADVVRLTVTPESVLDLATLFDCEEGEFEVVWSGAVNVSETINVGRGTSLHIVGNTTVTTTSSSSTPININGSSGTSQALPEFSSGLALPTGLLSAAVGVRPGNASFGPLFYVNGGQLSMEGLAIRNGFATSSTNKSLGSGGGVQAMNSNVTFFGCEFVDNFAESMGGGIFANRSTVVITNSVFRGCRAGFQSFAGDEDMSGVGGGVSVESTDILIDSCLFNECYANYKGGGLSHDMGRLSVVDSLFSTNSAGTDNVENKQEKGEGAAIFFAQCTSSFDGLAACGVNDTTFDKSHTASKGGAVTISSSFSVEFHRCTVTNSSTGKNIKDDMQGEGGAFVVGSNSTLLLSDCLLTNNYCGKKGGVVTLTSGDDWTENPGATLIFRNSTFTANLADLDNGGVVNVGEFCTVRILGENNNFTENKCGVDGGVGSATSNSRIVIEGGTFANNQAGERGGVFWSKGEIHILGGHFPGNSAQEGGGALCASVNSFVTLAGGFFEGNTALDGGVVNAESNSEMLVEGGVLTGNIATNRGGAFYVVDGAQINMTGGNFTGNEADFGGFLYKEGAGKVSCDNALIEKNKGVDGGAIYAINSATLEWDCDLRGNSALSGPAIYARENVTIIVRGVSLSDNFVLRGSTVFVVASNLRTYQVIFSDTSGSPDISAVQADEASTYKAEETSFVGFAGETVVFSEGVLFLDDCDFSETSAVELVYSKTQTSTIIRNAVLGDMNYLSIAAAASGAKLVPNARALTNVNITCDGVWEGATGASGSPCSEGSVCLDGDLGIYCQCYVRESTLKEACTSGDNGTFALNVTLSPETAYFPDLIEADLLLSFEPANDTSPDHDSSTMWNISVESSELIEWTVFPSTGVLRSGKSTGIRVVGEPSEDFEGSTTVRLQVHDVSSLGASSPTPSLSTLQTNQDNPISIQAQEERTSSTSPGDSDAIILQAENRGATIVSYDATFYHCAAGTFWTAGILSLSSDDNNDEVDNDDDAGDSCEICTEIATGYEEGLGCSKPGATTTTLTILPGYWRATLHTVDIHQCFNEDACIGGTVAQSTEEYCANGYEGPNCAICSSGFGKGASNSCHECTTGFTSFMYFILALMAMLLFIFAALLVVYLLKGRGAVVSALSTTKESISSLKSSILERSFWTTSRLWFQKRLSRESTSGKTFAGNGINTIPTNEADYGTTKAEKNERIASSPVEREFVGANTGTSTVQGKVEAFPSADGGGMRSLARPSWSGKHATRKTATSIENGVREDCVTSSPASITSTFSAVGAGGAEKNDIPFFGVGAGGAEKHDIPFWGVGSLRSFSRPVHGTIETDRKANNLSYMTSTTLENSDPSYDCFSLREDEYKRTDKEEEPSLSPAESSHIIRPRLSFVEAQTTPERGGNVGMEEVREGKPEGEEFGVEETEEGRSEERLKKTVMNTSRIGLALTKIPLSKIRIMIVVWQISNSFTQITQVPFPAIYEKFNSCLGVISFDITWIFSATCLAEGLNFYDKLLAATLGPLGFLCILGVTFSIGSSMLEDSSLVHREPTRSSSYFSIPSFYRKKGSDAVVKPEGLSKVGEGESGACDPSLLTNSSENKGKKGELDVREVESFTEFIFPSRFSRTPKQRLRSISATEHREQSDSHKNQLWWLFSRHATVLLILLYLVYAQVSTVIFQAFPCERIPEFGQSYLIADYSVVCYTPKHKFYRVYAGIMAIVYPLGIPAAIWYFLAGQSSRINPVVSKDPHSCNGETNEVQAKIKKRSTDKIIAPTSFLWNAYYPNRYYFEVFECVRRLLLTGVLVFLKSGTPAQVAFSCVFAFVCLLGFEFLRPHIDQVDMQLYRAGCLVIFFTNFLALLIKARIADADSDSSTAYAIVLIAMNVLTFLSIWWNSWAGVKATFDRRHFQGMVLGVEVVGDKHVDSFLGQRKKVGKQQEAKYDPLTRQEVGKAKIGTKDVKAPTA